MFNQDHTIFTVNTKTLLGSLYPKNVKEKEEKQIRSGFIYPKCEGRNRSSRIRLSRNSPVISCISYLATENYSKIP